MGHTLILTGDCLVQVIDSSDTSYQHVAFRLQAEYGEISFPAFASLILEASGDPRRMDVHWRPYYARCDYCNIPYTVKRAENVGVSKISIHTLLGDCKGREFLH